MFDAKYELNQYKVRIEMCRSRLEAVTRNRIISERIYYTKLLKELKARYEDLLFLESQRENIEIAVYEFLADVWNRSEDMVLEMSGSEFFRSGSVNNADNVVLIHHGTDAGEEPIIKWEYARAFADKFIEKRGTW